MTQVADIITDAYRETNLIAALASPSPTETTEALRRLQAIVLSTLGNEVGYVMEDWNISDTAIVRPSGIPLPSTSGFFVKPNSRLMVGLNTPMTISLDPQPQDGQRFSVVDVKKNFETNNLTVDPNGRFIEGESGPKVFSTNGVALQWFYRADVASWVVIDPLDVASEMPFPSDFDDYFIILLAMRLNPRHGKELKQASVDRLKQQQEQFVARYTQSRLRTLPTSEG